jgi:recombination protein RecT
MSEENKGTTAAATTGGTTPPSNAVAKPQADIKTLLGGEIFRKQVALCLPKNLAPDRFCRIAITALTRTPKLAECTQRSFFGCLLALSQYGLEPDGRRAHLIPYGKECTLIIDYKGLVELIYRNANVASVYASVVCTNDLFVWDRGQIKQHVIDFKEKRGEVYAVYAIIRMKDGSELADCMTKEEVEAIRKRSKAGQSGPWVTDWAEMAKKTVVRRLSKYVPMPSEITQAFNGDDDRPSNIAKSGVIDIPAELITDGSDKEPEAADPFIAQDNAKEKPAKGGKAKDIEAAATEKPTADAAGAAFNLKP